MSPYFAFYKGKEEKLFPYYRNFRLFEFFLKVPPPKKIACSALNYIIYYILLIQYITYLKLIWLYFLNLVIPPYPILSYPILSYPILSYPILSYPILSYHIRPFYGDLHRIWLGYRYEIDLISIWYGSDLDLIWILYLIGMLSSGYLIAPMHGPDFTTSSRFICP